MKDPSTTVPRGNEKITTAKNLTHLIHSRGEVHQEEFVRQSVRPHVETVTERLRVNACDHVACQWNLWETSRIGAEDDDVWLDTFSKTDGIEMFYTVV
jgi:hypothetical protein